jgi:hypothetical protein
MLSRTEWKQRGEPQNEADIGLLDDLIEYTTGANSIILTQEKCHLGKWRSFNGLWFVLVKSLCLV